MAVTIRYIYIDSLTYTVTYGLVNYIVMLFSATFLHTDIIMYAIEFTTSVCLFVYYNTGQLRGMLPCLGGGRHSFLSATIPPSTPSTSREEEEEEGWKQCVFFNDGQGAVCCVPLGVD